MYDGQANHTCTGIIRAFAGEATTDLVTLLLQDTLAQGDDHALDELEELLTKEAVMYAYRPEALRRSGPLIRVARAGLERCLFSDDLKPVG